jgi:hypothetical protein
VRLSPDADVIHPDSVCRRPTSGYRASRHDRSLLRPRGGADVVSYLACSTRIVAPSSG